MDEESVIVDNSQQLEKTRFPILDRHVGRIIVGSSVQYINALSPIEITELGMSIDLSLRQLRNACFSIVVIDSGNIIELRLACCLKADLPMAVTVYVMPL